MRGWPALVATVAIHAAAFATLLALPAEHVRVAVAPKYSDVDLIELEAPRFGEREVAPTRESGTERDAAKAKREPEGEREPGPKPGRKSPATPRSEPVQPGPETSRAPEASSSPAPPSEPAGPRPLALSGLRRSTTRARAPRLSGAVVQRAVPRVVRPRPAPALADDAVFRTPAEAGFKRARDGRLLFRDPDPKAQWTAQLLPDGRIRFKDTLIPRGQMPTASDLTHLPDFIRKAQGMNLWVKRKQRLLAATRGMRLTMAVAFAEKNIDRQLSRLYRDLLEIWRGAQPPWTRRALIFATWDDCEESLVVDLGDFTDAEGSKVDTIRHDAGARARREIVAFIQRHIPNDSTDAFTAAELGTFNRRRHSRERFAPYDGR